MNYNAKKSRQSVAVAACISNRPKPKRDIIFALILIAICRLTHAANIANDWTKTEITGEAVYIAAHFGDWAQTRFIALHPANFYESFNRVLGKHPSTDKVDIWFAATLVSQILIADALPHKWRKAWIASGVALELSMNKHNAELGIKWEW